MKIEHHINEEQTLYSEHMDLEQAMHGAQDFFAWDEKPPTYKDDDLDLEVV